jgi:hypothetical protein
MKPYWARYEAVKAKYQMFYRGQTWSVTVHSLRKMLKVPYPVAQEQLLQLLEQ